jgi:IstB-like ATP binding protein
MFQVIANRAEKAAVIVTTNLPFSEWSHVILNRRLCKPLVGRLTDEAPIITTGPDSYRRDADEPWSIGPDRRCFWALGSLNNIHPNRLAFG